MNSADSLALPASSGKYGERILGYDECAEIFRRDGRIFRGIYPGWGEYYRAILAELNQLPAASEIVTTVDIGPDNDGSFERLFEHEPITFVTYPHEWTPEMLRDAALFHVDLFGKLADKGLILKDWHPYNILFQGTKPVFVDFPSVIRCEDLTKVPYLASAKTRRRPRGLGLFEKYLYEMYRRMCQPYFMLPLHLMAQGDVRHAQKRLLEGTLNASSAAAPLNSLEVFARSRRGRLRYEWGERMKIAALALPGRGALFFSLLRQELQRLKVAPAPSAYARYYEDKGEAFAWTPSSEWTAKQHLVHEIIGSSRPETVVDLGANTGWYSVLAARSGAKVAAVEVDPSCAEVIYRLATEHDLSITPVVLDLDDLDRTIPGGPPDVGARPPVLVSTAPLLLSAEERLRADLVLALAVMHHLTLGRGWSFDRLARSLQKLAAKTLVVEFVAIEDEKVTGEPSFFPAYSASPDEFGWYNLDSFRSELSKYFKNIEVVPINETRHALVCKR